MVIDGETVAKTEGSRYLPWLFVSLTICATVFSQLAFKLAAGPVIGGTGEGLQRWINTWFIAGGVACLFGMFSWLAALRRLPVSQAYPWTAAVYVLTPIVSFFCFGDSLTWPYCVGIVLICVGILITTRNAGTVS
ncbi:small multidrug resistance family protein [Achromobacter xylosoxidans A8]|uniref:Small multidrug resistance family protein n=1 Tax=Achromobacter xylosoxidans (strain A8) TaxID=762376 RepID=E3HQG7_ACHXA|nr:EamA family transporter [Achromobacter xylosoxidans]ADP19601.1 small multidrug resistance family protein [Achromobacter xylosoxidans A8]